MLLAGDERFRSGLIAGLADSGLRRVELADLDAGERRSELEGVPALGQDVGEHRERVHLFAPDVGLDLDALVREQQRHGLDLRPQHLVLDGRHEHR